MQLRSTRLNLTLLCLWVSIGSAAGESASPLISLSDLTVRPEPGESRLPDASTAATWLDANALAASGGQHIQDVLSHSPNLTWAGGTSRPRYFQMRGIGERSQFAGEGPPNFSVGFLVDDIDFSGIGMHASLFDVEDVEILRGPQAAIYGSKALAGLINIRTRAPAPVPDAHVAVTAGSDALAGLSIAGGGPLTQDPDNLQLRVVAEHQQANGFRHNQFLNRNDTDKRDESAGRIKLRWKPSDDWQWDLTALFAETDNGYDQFTPDNNGFTTFADKPGNDAQESFGGSLRATWMRPATYRLLSITTYVESDIHYSYDADWGHDAYWAAAPYGWDPAVEGYAYDFTESLIRTRRN
ncbi:MAG: TonB-dependent receptor plug domain-containing protein, partial [Verrucomicrobia bacterium]|nr:TonB-dependent receptor plug domain-containing protein [Verrucomicrobiota bacterium]